ncbi:hypothetical protein [Halocalculus aciditolerans]|nr:hypothetical protein [Halocalculus aciditolerans]
MTGSVVVSAEPLRVRLDVTVEGETATAVVDESASVASFERGER